MVLSCAHTDRTSPIRDRRGAWLSVVGGERDSGNPGLSGRLGRTFAWLHPAACVTLNHRTTAPMLSRAGQPGVFKLGLNLAGEPCDSCLCCRLHPPVARPASASPLPTQNSGTF